MFIVCILENRVFVVPLDGTWLLSASITGRCLRLLEVYLTAVKCVSKLYVEELKTGVSNVILQH